MGIKGFGSFRSVTTIAGGVIYACAALAAVLVVVRIVDHDPGAAWWLALFGLVWLVAAWLLMTNLARLAAENAEELARLHRTTRAISERQAQMLADMVERLDGLTHWAAMSEATRSLLVRPREMEVFVKQIETRIGEGDWAESERLIKLFADHFNAADQARKLRDRMNSVRETADDRVIRERISQIRAMIDQQNFPAAELALGRLAKEYPEDKRLDDLRATYARAHRRYREAGEDRFRRLLGERRFDEAASQLDEMIWLEPDALHALRETWKEGFRIGQQESRTEFMAAVKEKRWAQAAELGEHILEQYPDNALATEVRKVIDTIRERSKPADGAPGPDSSAVDR